MKKVLIWIILSLFFQAGIYLYIDQYLLSPSSAFSKTQLAKSGNSQTASENILYSYDNKYAAKQTATALEILRLPAKTSEKTVSLTAQKLSYIHWLPDRDVLIYALYGNNNQGGAVELHTFNAETSGEPFVPKMKGLISGSKITDVAFSVRTNVIYMKVSASANNSALYRTDANQTLNTVSVGIKDIGRIFSLNNTDTLLFEDQNNQSVYAFNHLRGTKTKISPSNGNYCLVGVDHNDNIYIGKLNGNGKVTEVLKGQSGNDMTTANVYSTPVNAKNLTVDAKGNLTETNK